MSEIDDLGESSVIIRPATATAADRAGIVALAPRLAESVAPWRDQREARNAGRRWLEGSLDDAAKGTGAVFIAVDERAAAGQAPSATGGVVGVISVHPAQHFTGEQDGYIGELVVAELAARRGVGRSLIAAAEAWARDHGLAHLTLHAGAYNGDARAFYASLGFAEEEVRLTRPVPPA
jgi:ribosomal protein S18 acetylase RimI-like enzyme